VDCDLVRHANNIGIVNSAQILAETNSKFTSVVYCQQEVPEHLFDTGNTPCSVKLLVRCNTVQY